MRLAPERLRDRRAAILVALFSFCVYNANFRQIGCNDSVATRFLPLALARFGTLTLNPLESAARNHSPEPYWLAGGGHGRLVSRYPVATAVIVTPLYFPAVLYLNARGWTVGRVERVGLVMEKFSASVLTAISVGLVFLLLRRRLPRGAAIGLSMVYAFATCTWVISSQALWQNAVPEMSIAAALLLATGVFTPVRAAAAGFFCGLAACARPPDVILAAGFTIFLLLFERQRLLFFLTGAIPPAGLTLAYNLSYFGRVYGGYGDSPTIAGLFRVPIWQGLWVVLLSPAWGILAYSPFLAFLVLGTARPARERTLAHCLAAAIALQVVIYSLFASRGGACYGQRYLLNFVPILLWMVAPVFAGLRWPGRIVFFAAALAGAAIQLIGAYCFPMGGTAGLSGPWPPSRPKFVAELKGGFAGMSFLHPNLGEIFGVHIDAAAAAGQGSSIISTVDLLPEDAAAASTPVDLVIDIFTRDAPRHPDRHYGFWTCLLPASSARRSLSLELDTARHEMRARLDGTLLEGGDSRMAFGGWSGPIREGDFRATLAVSGPGLVSGHWAHPLFDFSVRQGKLAVRPLEPLHETF